MKQGQTSLSVPLESIVLVSSLALCWSLFLKAAEKAFARGGFPKPTARQGLPGQNPLVGVEFSMPLKMCLGWSVTVEVVIYHTSLPEDTVHDTAGHHGSPRRLPQARPSPAAGTRRKRAWRPQRPPHGSGHHRRRHRGRFGCGTTAPRTAAVGGAATDFAAASLRGVPYPTCTV